MYCRLCGTHLYKNITFRNLFKMNYFIHEECEMLLNKSTDYITIPFMDKLLLIDYLFEEKSEDSDEGFLYDRYSSLLFERMLGSDEWSIMYIVDDLLESGDLILLTKLAEKAILILNVFNDNFMKIE